MSCKSAWRTRIRGTPRQIGKKFRLTARTSSSKLPKGLQKSMFYERTGYYAGKVKMDNPFNAAKSANWLEDEFDKARRNGNVKRMTRILKITQLAANRARAILKRKNLSRREKGEFREIAEIYGSTAKEMRETLSYYKYHRRLV